MTTPAKVLLAVFLWSIIGLGWLANKYGQLALLLFLASLEDPAGRFVIGLVAFLVVALGAALVWAYGYWRNRQRQAVIIELLNYVIQNMK